MKSSLHVAMALLLATGLAGCNVDTAPELDGAEHVEEQGEALCSSTLTFRPGPEGKDANVFSHPSNVNQNRGNVKELDALSWTFSGVPGTYRSYIQFDLSSIPPGTSVINATLTLYANTTPGVNLAGHSTLSGPNNGWLARVTGPWSESTITWNNQPPVDLANAIAIPASVSSSQTYYINVTSMVNNMVQNPGSNNGFMLRLATEDYWRALRFWSGDADSASQRPKLTVTIAGSGDCCGDGYCTGSETCSSCAIDCGSCNGCLPYLTANGTEVYPPCEQQ